jgi:hypothetical protein
VVGRSTASLGEMARLSVSEATNRST